MLFLSESTIDAANKIWGQLAEGKVPPAEGIESILELIPDDLGALLEMARLRREAGDPVAAEECAWRAVKAHSCMAPAYLELTLSLGVQPGKKALAEAFCELAMGMADLDETVLDRLNWEEAGIDTPEARDFGNLSAAAKRRLVSMSLQAQAGPEPVEVSVQLRPFRLVRDLWENEDFGAEKVNEILAGGAAMPPLLAGVLRAWARGLLGDAGNRAAENALGLLGEMGTVSDLPTVFEFVGIRDENIAGAAGWAARRIVERHRKEASRFFAEAIPGLDLVGRITVCEQVLRFPDVDPEGALLRQLCDGLTSWTVGDRDLYAMGLVTAAAVRGGERRLDAAGEILRRLDPQLSATGRKNCQTMLKKLTEGAEGFEAPEIPPDSIYEICGGEALWGVDDFDEDDFDDEDFDGDFFDDEEEEDDEPIAPVRRAAVPGRNDPCWCGSGKKYKKCHLESDEKGSRGAAEPAVIPRGLDGLRRRIGQFAKEVLPQAESRRLASAFIGEERALAEHEMMAFVDWTVHDYTAPRLGRTVMEEFLARNGARLSAQEREMVSAWGKSCVSLWEAQDVKPGTGVAMKNLLTGEPVFVHDVSLSRQLVRWDAALMRVLPGERGMESTGEGVGISQPTIAMFRQWLEAEQVKSGLGWTAFLKREAPRVRQEAMAVHQRWRDGLRLTNTDGEELLFSTARYGVADRDGVLAALGKCGELEAGSNDGEFVWVNKEKTILGNVRLEAGGLKLECNSRARLERGKKVLAGVAGGLLTHEGDAFETAAEMKRRAVHEPPVEKAEENSIPKDVRDRIVAEYMEKHYEGWPDTKLPGLGGKTPRQAVKTASGRAEVIAMLKMMENGEERKRQAGEPYYDVSRLRAKLGIGE